MVGRRNRSRVRGIDQLLANASQLGKGLGTKLVRALVELLFNDPEVTKIQTDPSPSNLRAIRCYEKAGFERQGTVTTPDGPAVYMVQTRRHSSEHAVLPNPSIEGTSKGWRPGRPSCQTLNIMREAVIAEVSTQLSEVVGVIERHLEPTLLAVHLYGSAVDGGLKPHSDIDLLVTVTVRLDETTRRALINDLLETSASPESEILRAVEVTIVVHDDIIPWRYPAKRELQFGEWQRNDILAGIFEPATIDIDLAILLTKAREHSVALVGPAAEELFDPVPEQDLFEALNETLTLWNSPPDWAGDERNVVLTLSRIWYSAVTGKIAPKDVAADWAMERLPAQYQPVILEARQAYLGQEDRLASRADQLEEFVHYVKGEITKVVGK